MAAALRAGDGARVSGPAVLGLFGLDGFTSMPGIDRRVIANVPITKVPLALLETATTGVADRRLRVAIDSACRRRLTTRQTLVERALQLGRDHAGAAWLLDLEGGGGLRADSEKEREVTAVLSSVHPRPEVQAWLTNRIRPDYLWRHLRLVGEYLGWVDHDPSNLRDDARFRAIRDLDHDIITITARDLHDPVALIECVQIRLVRRARQLGVPLA